MNIQKLLQSLVDHKVKSLVIGGWSLPVYGFTRATYDIDIFFEPPNSNAKCIMKALTNFGYIGIQDLTMEEL